MSDTVDDLHAAEALAALQMQDPFGDPDSWLTALSDAHVVCLAWETYCRPTCGAEGDPDSEECDDADCGCPCGHADPTDDHEPPERELPGDEP